MLNQFAARIAASRGFSALVMLAILAAGILVGLETNEALAARNHALFSSLDLLILGIFTLEIVVKILACGDRPLDYFRDPWNVFDFLIVAVCFLPFDAQYVAILRLVRILRIFKLVSALPKLQILIGALLKSVPSMSYIGLFLCLLFYVYGVMGVFLFGKNDPDSFGSLPVSFLTLFQVVTLEGWADIFKTAFYGSGADYKSITGAAAVPLAQPVAATIYFITFILFGTMIVLNLFIGVIVSGMEEAKEETEKFNEAALQKTVAATESTLDDELHKDLQIMLLEVEQLQKRLRDMDKKLGG